MHSAYSTPSSLYIRDRITQSAKRVQQGDPLGPPLFRLATLWITEHLRSEFYMFYLDDSPLAGPLDISFTIFRLWSSVHSTTKALEAMGSRLRYLQAHDAYCLLRHAFAVPKVLYIIRTSLTNLYFPQDFPFSPNSHPSEGLECLLGYSSVKGPSAGSH